jgi:hypothetical protein
MFTPRERWPREAMCLFQLSGPPMGKPQYYSLTACGCGVCRIAQPFTAEELRALGKVRCPLCGHIVPEAIKRYW